jgi:hypothetical protein
MLSAETLRRVAADARKRVNAVNISNTLYIIVLFWFHCNLFFDKLSTSEL